MECPNTLDSRSSSDDKHPSKSSTKPKSRSKHSLSPAEFGLTTEIRNLYRDSTRSPWEEWAPDDIGIASQVPSDSEKFALIVRKERSNIEADDQSLKLHSITIQSPIIKKFLGDVFTDYPGINTSLRKVTFHAPFYEFHYRWGRFCDVQPPEDQEKEYSHYKTLFDVISPEILEGIEQQKDLLKNQVVSFQYVWILFEPGMEIYSRINGHHNLYLLNSGGYQRIGKSHVYALYCRYIDCDGSSFGYATTTLVIHEFEQFQKLKDLNAIPSKLQSDIDEIRAQLKSRGKVFERLRGVHYKSYTGMSLMELVPQRAPQRFYADSSRIIIDCRSFTRYNAKTPMALDPLDTKGDNTISIYHTLDSMAGDDDLEETDIRRLFSSYVSSAANRARSTGGRRSKATSLSEHHYQFCAPVVKGFNLKAKKWGTFYVDAVHDITWNEVAFNRLVLPCAFKEMILGFVHSQLAGVDQFDDVIAGKGQGVIMLFSGEPGTGKTLTSESVAEEMKRPLYATSAGELGSEAGVVERNLERVLDLSTQWGAVLLLDECDVFLERRSSFDIQRNQLVSVFLRLLEYHRGVLLMTTNRAADLDPAFESRIHLHVKYPPLKRKSRREIWRGFLDSFHDDELDELATEELNGREIKNVVKSARLLAAREGNPVALEHIRKVLVVKRGIWDDTSEDD